MNSQSAPLRPSRRAPSETIGDHVLCAWTVAPSVIWIQTRDPKHARRLEQRADGRLVARGVLGGYLRTFEFQGRTLAWAERLIDRYSANETATNSGKSRDSSLQGASNLRRVSPQRTRVSARRTGPGQLRGTNAIELLRSFPGLGI